MTTPLHNSQKSAAALSTAGPSPSSSIKIEAKELDQRLAPSQDIKVNGVTICALEIAPFLRKVYDAITAQFGPPSRFDLTGGALATLTEGSGAIQDIDIAIEYPESHTPRLREFKACLQKAMGIPKDKDPFFRKSQVPDPEFTAVLLSCGDEESFWIDFTITTKKKRTHLFRKDDIRASLTPYLLHGQSIIVESTEHDPACVLQDRKEKRIVIERPEELNHMGWPLLLLSLAKGNTLETTSAEPILQATFQNYVKSGKEGALSIIKRVFASHGHPNVRGRFYLSAFLSLLKSSTDQELQYIAHECSKKKNFDALFLNYVANNCLSNKEKRSQFICLSYLLDLAPWPKPTDEEWKKFLSNLKEASWIENQFPSHIHEKLKDPLHKLAFSKILSTTDFNQKKCLDALYKSLSDDEMKSLLPQRLAYELPLSPELAISTYQNHYSHLSPETRLTFINALLIPKKQSFLYKTLEIERSRRADDFPAFLAQFPKEKAAIPLLTHLLDKTPITEFLPLLRNYQKEPQIASLLRQKASTLLDTQKEPSIAAVLFLSRFLPKDKQEKTFVWLDKNLFPLPTMTEDMKESLLELWPALCPYLSDKNRTALLSVLKKWGLTLNESDLPSLLSLSEPLIESLLKEAKMEREVRTRLMNQLLLLKEQSGKFEESFQLYHEKKHLFSTDPEKLSLYRSLSPHSLITPSLYLDLESPPVEDFQLHLSKFIQHKKWDLLPPYIHLAIRWKIPSIISALSTIEGFDEEKVELLSSFPSLITLPFLQKISHSALSKPAAKKLFSWLLECPLSNGVLPLIEPLYEKVDPSYRLQKLTLLVKRLATESAPTQQKHLLHAVIGISCHKWQDYPLDALLDLLSLLQDKQEFTEPAIALLIRSNTESSIITATQKMMGYCSPQTWELVLLLLRTIARFGFIKNEEIYLFLQFMTSTNSSKIKTIKEALSEAQGAYLLRCSISTYLSYYDESEKKQLISLFHRLHEIESREEFLDFLIELDLSHLPNELCPLIAKTVEEQLDCWRDDENGHPISVCEKVAMQYTKLFFLGYQKHDNWLYKQASKQLYFFIALLKNRTTLVSFYNSITTFFLCWKNQLIPNDGATLQCEYEDLSSHLFQQLRTNKFGRYLELTFYITIHEIKLPFASSTEFLRLMGNFLFSSQPKKLKHETRCLLQEVLVSFIKLLQQNPKGNEALFIDAFYALTHVTEFSKKGISSYSAKNINPLIEGCRLLLTLQPPLSHLQKKWETMKNVLISGCIDFELYLNSTEGKDLLESFIFRNPPFADAVEAALHLDNCKVVIEKLWSGKKLFPEAHDRLVAIFLMIKKRANFVSSKLPSKSFTNVGVKMVFDYIAKMASTLYFQPFFDLALWILDEHMTHLEMTKEVLQYLFHITQHDPERRAILRKHIESDVQKLIEMHVDPAPIVEIIRAYD